MPARNEEQRIRACVDSLITAASAVDVPVAIVVAADQCSDSTAIVAQEVFAELETANPPDAVGAHMTGAVVQSSFGSAGAARSLAIDTALSLIALPLESLCVATTDADTVVDASWLATHLRWADQGVDGVAGLVQIDWEPGADQLMEL